MKRPREGPFCLEREMGIEPTLFAWEARVLPLNDTRMLWIVLCENRKPTANICRPRVRICLAGDAIDPESGLTRWTGWPGLTKLNVFSP